MSVPENARTKGKLEACVKAHDLACYTLQITTNKKNFPEQFQAALTDKIVSAALVDDSYSAWRNHAGKGNTFRLLCRMDQYYINLWR